MWDIRQIPGGGHRFESHVFLVVRISLCGLVVWFCSHLLTCMSGSWDGHSLGIRRPSPQALTCLGRAQFITRRLRCSFLEECWLGPMHFWNRRVWPGSCLAPGFHIKKSLEPKFGAYGASDKHYELGTGQLCRAYSLNSFPHSAMLSEPLGQNALQRVVHRSTRIGSVVFWLWWQLVAAAWHGYRIAGIHVTRAKTGPSWVSGGRPTRLSSTTPRHG